MSKELYRRYQLAEAQGGIPRGSAAKLTMATILEAGVKAATQAYYGQQAVSEAAKAEQDALDATDDTIQDIRAVTKAYGDLDAFMHDQGGVSAAHTTSDFPKALANLRRRVIRQDTPIAMSGWRSWIPARLVGTTPDFKPVRGLNMDELSGLVKRPEGGDVEYTTLGFSDEQFMVANYERALNYTWEMWVNDEVNAFQRALGKMGEAARRTEATTIFTAILNGVSRSSETGITTGAPNATRIKAARAAMAARTVTDAEGDSVVANVEGTDIVVPTSFRDDAEVALGTQYTDYQAGAPNVVYRALDLHVERLWAGVFTSDWVVFDREVDWIDVRFLQGFEGGPQFYTKMPDVQESPDQGSFDNHSLAVKVGHTLGAKVVNAKGVLRNQGA